MLMVLIMALARVILHGRSHRLSTVTGMVLALVVLHGHGDGDGDGDGPGHGHRNPTW